MVPAPLQGPPLHVHSSSKASFASCSSKASTEAAPASAWADAEAAKGGGSDPPPQPAHAESTVTSRVRCEEDAEGIEEETKARRPSRWNTRVSMLVDSLGVQSQLLDGASWEGLNDATFKDLRWESALRHLREEMEMKGEGWANEVLRTGARSFGLWHVSDLALASLAEQLLGKESKVSPALEAWLFQFRLGLEPSESPTRTITRVSRKRKTAINIKARSRTPSFTALDVRVYVQSKLGSTFRFCRAMKTKLALVAGILLVSFLIVVPKGPSAALDTFGWPLMVARMTGVGALLWTCALFLTMSRTLLKYLYLWLPAGLETRILDQHTPLHAFCGKMVLVFGLIHTVAHFFSTYQSLALASLEDLNNALNCAQPSRPMEGAFELVPYLRWPPCPFERNYSYSESLVMPPAITGIALFAVLWLMARTSRSSYSGKYERFWNTHNWGMWLWYIFLFLHGTKDWFGVGVPLVVPVCTVPVSLYIVDRALRALRFYLLKDRISIVSVVIRPGQDGGAGNAMTALEISKPPFLWSMQEGMYAYLCIPEISRWQWHPFTICSCGEDDTVDFIIQGVGDWTTALSQRCLDLRQGLQPAPVVALDGPYAAPVTTALASEVLVAVGAGVGITPFLSLLACIIAALGDEKGRRRLPLQEAHFFWIARSGDEFLFGRRHFTRVATRPRVREKVFLHLHLTQREPERDAPAFLFREAIRRQSAVDRAAFAAATDQLPGELLPRPQLPWSWVDGSCLDVAWISGLVETGDEGEESRLAEAYADHWAEGYLQAEPPSTSSAFNSSHLLRQKMRGRSGLFRDRTLSTCTNLTLPSPRLSGVEALVPVAFGRPDFAMEIQAIGKARLDRDINVYACGNDSLVESLRDVCKVCNERARSKNTPKRQRYIFRHERFGGK